MMNNEVMNNETIIAQLPPVEDIEYYIKKKTMENSLLEYVKYFFKVMNNQEFIVNWHHVKICEVLEKVYYGHLRNVIINIPPRYSKTEIVVKYFISWCLAKDSGSRFIHLSYSDSLALDNSQATKEIVCHEEYRRFWPFELSKANKSKSLWYTREKGGVYATSTGGQITGFGAGGTIEGFRGALVIDDPIKPDDAKSETIRKRINDRFNNTIKSRLNNPSETPVIIIMQRVHEEDMTGFLLGGGSELEFTHINLPAINEDGPSEYDIRKEGEALWPKKHDVKALKLMSEKDSMTYAGQYQQRPSPLEGNIIKRDDIQFYREVPDKFLFVVHSWDCTFKDSEKSDFVVGLVIAKDRKNYYLLDQYRKRAGFVETKKAMINMIDDYPRYNALLIEDKANGSAIIETLKEKIGKIVAINPKESKVARFEAISDLFASHNVFFPHPDIAPWINDFIDEIALLPNGKFDDRCDALSQGLNHIENKTRSSLYKMTT